MLVIRLARTGRKKYPTYRIVAAESARAVTGKFVAILGHYNPHTKELVLKKDETERYIGNGAQPSNSVIRLLQQEKVKLPDWVKYHSKNKPSKQEQAEESSETKADAGDAKSEEAVPAEEAAVATVAAENAEAVEEKAAELPGEDEGPAETAATDEAAAESSEEANKVAAEAASDTSDDQNS